MTVLSATLVFVLGLAVGFGINVVATRLAMGRPLFGGLGCTRAPHSISVRQALPVAGFLMQRGRCSTCGKRLALSYPLTELLMGGLLLALYLDKGWGLPFLFHAAYTAFLVLVLVNDWKYRDIYVSVIVAGSLVALLGSVLLPGVGLTNALIAAGIGGSFFLVAFLLAKALFPRIEEPLGTGDVLLAIMMGLMLGLPNIVGALLVGPLIGGIAAIFLLVSRRGRLGDFMPYGVALCVASILFLVYPAPFAEALNLPELMELLSGVFGQS